MWRWIFHTIWQGFLRSDLQDLFLTFPNNGTKSNTFRGLLVLIPLLISVVSIVIQVWLQIFLFSHLCFDFFFNKWQNFWSGKIECFCELKNRNQGRLLMATFQEWNEAAVEIAYLGKLLLRDLMFLSEIPDYFSKRLFDCQGRLLVKET